MHFFPKARHYLENRLLKKTIASCGKNVFLPYSVKLYGHDVHIENISIGEGSLRMCAGAVVTRNVAPYTIVGGIPTRHIGD